MDNHSSSPSGLDDNLFLSAQRESESLKERLFELYLLYTTSRTCSISLQTDALFQNIAALLKNTLKVEEFCLMLENQETGLFEVWAADELVLKAAGEFSFRPGEGISGLVAETGEPILVQDVSREKRFLHYKGMLPNIGSFLSIPLTALDGKVFGVLNLHKTQANGFHEHDKNFFSAVANNLASAMERSRLYEKARKEAMLDELTGIHNRRYFMEYAGRELFKARRHHNAMALIMLDIDHFKTVNDTYGHAVGDQVLIALANALRNGIRQSDMVARYGGEEFVILLPETGMESACRLADKLREESIREATAALPAEPHGAITFTAGVACFPDDGDTRDELLEAADRRLYLGKSQGRNRVIGAALEPPAFTTPSNRRHYPRYQAALRMIHHNDCGNTAVQPIHSIDIRHNDEWISCTLLDVSKNGFNCILAHFEPQSGAQYFCRAMLDPKNGQPRPFAVQIRHVQSLDDHSCLMGAQVNEQDTPVWRLIYAALAQ